MPRRRLPLLLLALAALAAAAPAAGRSPGPDRLARLSAAAPGLDRDVLALGLLVHARAVEAGHARRGVLAVIDYTLPSRTPRLWVFDLERGALLFHERVAHGRGSDGPDAAAGTAVAFSNLARSHASSLGVFVGGEAYEGRHGRSLRLDGLEPGVNDAARRRAIVIHGAEYVTDAFVAAHGRAGRSQGCPAVDPAVAPRLVEALADGAVLLAYHPDPAWRARSAYVRDESVARS